MMYCCNRVARRRKQDPSNGTGRSCWKTHAAFLSSHIPYAHHLINSSAGQRLAIGGKRNGINWTGVAVQDGARLPFGQKPPAGERELPQEQGQENDDPFTPSAKTHKCPSFV